MTTFEPIETADASAAVTTLLSKMFEFDPTLTLPENAIRTTTDAAHFLGDWDEIPETTALYQTELFSPMETSPMTEALECVSKHDTGISGEAKPGSHKSPEGKNGGLAS